MKDLAWTASLAALLWATTACAQTVAADARPAITQASEAVASSPYRTTTHLYATNDGQALHLDRIVDTSVKVDGKRPVIIFSFGGGWEGGARNDEGMKGIHQYLASLGYEVMAIDYWLGIKIAKQR